MKNIIRVAVAINCLAAGRCFAQGWVAEVDVDLNHGLYAYETIENARLTFSGVTMSGSSDRSNIQFTVKGTGSPSGDINLSISGTAFEPYDPNDPSSQSLYGQLVANYKIPCTTGYFKSENTVTHEQVSLWITFYPRLEIDTYAQDCDKITLTTSSCYPTLFWEVSENMSENYKTVAGKTGTFMSITREELVSLGLESAHGKIHFRVTGTSGTTSQLQPVDTYYRSPNAAISATPPKCHNGTDGSIEIKILSPDASVINDFVITLHKAAPPEQAVRQVYLNDGINTSFSEIAAGNYWIRIENNSSEVYGSCWTDFALDPLLNPEPVTIGSFEVSNYHGYPIKCHAGNEGTLKVNPLGGTGSYSAFEWIPGVSTTAFADSLPAGTYSIKVQDSNGCWSGTHSRTLNAPDEMSVNLISSGGKNGFDVSCYDKTDGALSAQISGGVPQYAYAWSSGALENSLNNLSIGTYALIVTDANGCTTGESTQLIAPEPIQFAIREISPVNCSGDNSGILEAASIINTIGEVFYSWSSGEIEREIVSKPRGTYTLTVSDEQGCSSARSHTLKEPEPLQIQVVEMTEPSCHGECNGRLKVSAKGGNGDYNYGWEGSAGPEATELCAGTYEVTVSDTQGCISSRTISLTPPNPVIIKLISAKSPTCANGCDGIIEVAGFGGTGELRYSWSTGESEPTLRNVCSGSYTITATDANHCFATETTTLEDPKEKTLNLGGTITLCNGQTHVLDAGTQWQSVAWTSSIGFKSSSPQITISEAGQYWLNAVTPNGCVVQDTFLLETSADLLEANFLVTSEAMPGETVVIIDISWPLPDSIRWDLPREMIHLENYGDVLYTKIHDTGYYDISLVAALGNCRDEMTKTIRISNDDNVLEEGRLGHEPFVKTFSLFPNPNDGVFNVKVEFSEESPMLLSVWNTLTAQKIGQIEDSGQVTYVKHVNVQPLSAGEYTLRLDYRKGTKYLRFIVR